MGFVSRSESGELRDTQLSREETLRQIAEQALRINEKLLAERKPRKRRKVA